MTAHRKQLTLFDDYYGMMSDRVRMDAYRRAIARAVRPGDVVLDLGAGLGILTFLALEAGAGRVIAIEKSDSIELMRAVARKNGLEDRIEWVNVGSKQFEPLERASVLVSETLGSFALDENTLDFTIDARERLLTADARMVPELLTPMLCPVEAPETYRRVEYWRRPHGFDFTPALDEVLSRMSLVTLAPKQLMARPLPFASVHLRHATTSRLENKLLFEIQRPGTIHGLGGWFTATLFDDITLTTAPDAPSTHWQHAFFPLREPVTVVRGDYMEVTLSVEPKGPDSDDTKIAYDFRCTQLGREQTAVAGAAGRNDPCPCGSGKKHKKCCGGSG